MKPLRRIVEELVRIIDDAPERLTMWQIVQDLICCMGLLVALAAFAYFVVIGILSL